MNKLFLILLLAGAARLGAAENALIQAADAAWEQRDQEGRTLAAIALYQQALKADPSQKELWLKLTRAINRTVRYTSDKSERQTWAKRAEEAGRQAVAENPGASLAYAYHAEAVGQYAQAHKGLSSLKRVRQAMGLLEKAIQLDPDNWYAHMLLSSFYREAPAFSVGDKKKAVAQARKAVICGPQYSITHLTLARALLATGQKKEAATELRKTLALTPPSDLEPETRWDQATAKRLLEENRL